ncbi:AKH_1a_G0049580.mRNA.1.CDS.1 [Saccharomyces cerevisiae]|nr:AKH_1a_G0049580.mRNA.1.CDS.1 [Saccharomyces cerevisiae]CAI6881170.1 AKH_1a_G0049580.mRNA.1.CDS.1 [Saccharomyces cerevisiae]
MSKFSLKLGSKTLKKNISKKTKKKNSLQKANLFDWDDAETASLSHKPQSKIKIQSIDKFDLDEESSSKKKLVIKLSENADTKKNDAPLVEYVTEKEYNEVPVEEFGDALLRGMGWESDSEQDSKGDMTQSRNKDVSNVSQIHPDGLGIGAKLNKAINVEEASFMPVVKIDKITATKVDDDKKNKS